MDRSEIIEKIKFLKILLQLRENKGWQGFTEMEKEEYLNEVLDMINELLQLLNETENE
jgi:hypothetical protein